jgi:hypothetical protein
MGRDIDSEDMIEDGNWTTAGSHTRHSATITWFELSAFGKGGV